MPPCASASSPCRARSPRSAPPKPPSRSSAPCTAPTATALSAVQGRYYEVGADISRLEQSLEHTRELRERQRADLGQARADAARSRRAHRARRARARRGARGARAARPRARGRRSAPRARRPRQLEAAEQALQQWQQRWEAAHPPGERRRAERRGRAGAHRAAGAVSCGASTPRPSGWPRSTRRLGAQQADAQLAQLERRGGAGARGERGARRQRYAAPRRACNLRAARSSPPKRSWSETRARSRGGAVRS